MSKLRELIKAQRLARADIKNNRWARCENCDSLAPASTVHVLEGIGDNKIRCALCRRIVMARAIARAN